MKYGVWLGCASVLLLAACASLPPNARGDFAAFYSRFKSAVAAQGVNPESLDLAFGGDIQPVEQVLESEKNQPEFKDTFENYVGRMLAPSRRSQAVSRLDEHAVALGRIQAKTGVPAEVIVALWGIESNFGATTGGHPVIPSLVTLAWASPRGEFFGKEALAALRIAEREKMHPRSLTGSWAGAMGGPQFMPSTYLNHALDGDGDGKIDIWTDDDDVLASAGNYLKALGWVPSAAWRVQAHVTTQLPDKAGFNDRGLSEPFSIAQWQRWGVVPKREAFTQLGGLESSARLYRPLGVDGPTYLLGANYDVILKWNKSSYFATSVLLLAESIAKRGALPDV